MNKLALSLACIAAFTAPLAAHAGNILPAETTLSKGERVSSKNGIYHLIMQHDGNLVLYRGRFDPMLPKWSTSTVNSGWYTRMQADGNLAVYSNGRWAWQAGTGGRAMDMNYKLTLGDDGVLAIRLAADNNGGTLIKNLYEDVSPYNGGPVFSYPMHKYPYGSCVDSFTAPMQSGRDARDAARAAGGALGRCSDNLNSANY